LAGNKPAEGYLLAITNIGCKPFNPLLILEDGKYQIGLFPKANKALKR